MPSGTFAVDGCQARSWLSPTFLCQWLFPAVGVPQHEPTDPGEVLDWTPYLGLGLGARQSSRLLADPRAPIPTCRSLETYTAALLPHRLPSQSSSLQKHGDYWCHYLLRDLGKSLSLQETQFSNSKSEGHNHTDFTG